MSDRRRAVTDPTLRISADLSLPLSVAGEAIGVLATRGAGKSYTSAVLVEELHAAGVQLVVLDPTGVYWGLRSSADGNSEGLPLFVLGGAHGDVPLEPTAGKLIADVIVDTGQSLILDLSDFDTKSAQTRFVADLIERLYHRKARSRSTLHLIVDEANEFAPQSGGRHGGDMPRLLGAMERAVGKGRSRGLAFTLITQRSAALNKNVLDLIETLIAMRVLGPRDRKAIESWITDKQATDEGGVVESLPRLPTGTAWVWSPVRGILQKVAMRRIKTFDSYRTPEPGETRIEPTARAPLDVSALGDQIRATAERVKADDPRELRKQLVSLQRQLAQRPAEQVVETVVERVEVPVLNGQVDRLMTAAELLSETSTRLVEVGKQIRSAAGEIITAVESVRRAPTATVERPRPVSTFVRDSASAMLAESGPLSTYARALLETFARRHPLRLTRSQLGVLSGRSTRSSAFGPAVVELQRGGLIEGTADLGLTDAGWDAMGGAAPAPQSSGEIIETWRRALPTNTSRIFDVLIAAYPLALTREEIAERTGYSLTSSAFSPALSLLRKNGLAHVADGGLRASEDLFS
jgi:hypothetical protein